MNFEMLLKLINYHVSEINVFDNVAIFSHNQKDYAIEAEILLGEMKILTLFAHDFKKNKSYKFLLDKNGNSQEIAYDNIKFIELEVLDDFIQKSTAMINGKEYDEKIIVPIDLNEKEAEMLEVLAKEQNISIDEYVENILKEYINENKENL